MEALAQVVFPTQLGSKEREQLSKLLPGPGSQLSSNGRMDTDDTETVRPAFFRVFWVIGDLVIQDLVIGFGSKA